MSDWSRVDSSGTNSNFQADRFASAELKGKGRREFGKQYDKVLIDCDKPLIDCDKPLIDCDKPLIDCDKALIEDYETLIEDEKTLIETTNNLSPPHETQFVLE